MSDQKRLQEPGANDRSVADAAADRSLADRSQVETESVRPILESTFARSEPAETVNIPERIGDYRILNVIAVHGQGIVYRADHARLNRQVVIKVSRNALDEAAQQAVYAEGRALASLSHPNIAQIFDLIIDKGCPGLVMEYIEGRNLAELQAGAPMPYEDAACLVQTLCQAMQHVHSKGIIHRDLKPANVVIRAADREPKIIDFGLANARTAFSVEVNSSGYGGTIAYMAPEQARWLQEGLRGRQTEDPTNERTDIYALGGILYSLLTGEQLFQFRNLAEGLELASSFEFDDTPLRKRNVPVWLRNICLKAMARDPSDRFQSTAEMGNALGAPRRRPWLWPVIAAAVLLAAFAVLLISRLRPNEGNTAADSSHAESSRSAEIATPPATDGELVPILAEITHIERHGDDSLGAVSNLLAQVNPRLNDDIRWDVEFGRPAYAYLIALNPDGVVQPCFPVDPEQKQEVAVSVLHFPERRDQAFGLTDGIGQQAFLLVAGESPLPPLRQWLHAHNDLTQWDPSNESGAWVWQNRTLHPWKRNQVRGTLRDLPGKASFQQICEFVQRENPQATIYAVSFKVAPRDISSER